MKVLVDLCVVPIGVGVSLSSYIAACEKVLKDAGLKIALHSYGTNIEGEWDDVFRLSSAATRSYMPWVLPG